MRFSFLLTGVEPKSVTRGRCSANVHAGARTRRSDAEAE